MLAGFRRQRINAVKFSEIDNEPLVYDQPTGRPSKGGSLLRAKRYYAKNQMLNLRKGKVRRYFAKVKEILSEHNYRSVSVKKDLDENCELYYSQSILEEDIKKDYLFYALDYAREDGYLSFLNEEALNLVKANTSKEFDKNSVQLVLQNLASMHSRRFFFLTTLFSAYVLLHYVENKKKYKSIMNDVKKIDEIKKDCLECYTLQLEHLTNLPDDDTLLITYQNLNDNTHVKEEENYDGVKSDYEEQQEDNNVGKEELYETLEKDGVLISEEDVDNEQEEPVNIEEENTDKQEVYQKCDNGHLMETDDISSECKECKSLNKDDNQKASNEQVVKVNFKAPSLNKRPYKHSKKKNRRPSITQQRFKKSKK